MIPIPHLRFIAVSLSAEAYALPRRCSTASQAGVGARAKKKGRAPEGARPFSLAIRDD
jgi:hypothetical protein